MGRYNTRGEFSERTTVYLTPKIKKYLQHQAVERGTTLSAVVNDNFDRQLGRRSSK